MSGEGEPGGTTATTDSSLIGQEGSGPRPRSGWEAWQSAVTSTSAFAGLVAVVGVVNSGKSTFVLACANEASRAGRTVGVMDCDVEDGEFGPPGCLVLVHPQRPLAALAEAGHGVWAFVGDTTPSGHPAALVPAICRLTSIARARGDDVILADFPSYVPGRLGERLHMSSLVAMAPDLIVLLHRENELERLAELLRVAVAVPVLPVQTPREVAGRSQVYREIRRASRIRRHFTGAQVHEIIAARVSIYDAWLYSGRPIGPREIKLAGRELGCEVLRGEETPDGVFMLTAREPRPEGLQNLQEHFRKRRVVASPAAVLQNLLVGLIAGDGRLVDVGLLQGINFDRGVITVLSPVRSVEDIRLLHFGRVRLRPEGSGAVRLRATDL